MKITSFDTTGNNILRDPKQDYLFDLFQKNIVKTRNIVLIPYVVPREFEMRLDRISNYIFSSPDYVEELMVINDIIAQARTLIGVRFLHQGRDAAHGVDCLGLLLVVAAKLDIRFAKNIRSKLMCRIIARSLIRIFCKRSSRGFCSRFHSLICSLRILCCLKLMAAHSIWRC